VNAFVFVIILNYSSLVSDIPAGDANIFYSVSVLGLYCTVYYSDDLARHGKAIQTAEYNSAQFIATQRVHTS
jgi:hypothetical protein